MTKQSVQYEPFLSAANALLRSMELAPSSNPQDAWRFTSYKLYIRKYNQLVDAILAIGPIPIPLDRFDMAKVPSIGDTVSIQQAELFQAAHANLSMLRAWLEEQVGKVKHEASELATFLQTRIRSVLYEQPTCEKDVQNAVETLLIGRGMQKGIDYDRETGRVKVSVKECVPDFISRPLSLALEIKFVRDAGHHGRLVDEINADIMAYTTAYKSLVFLIYDLGTIRDEIQFRQSFESSGNVSVLVVKH